MRKTVRLCAGGWLLLALAALAACGTSGGNGNLYGSGGAATPSPTSATTGGTTIFTHSASVGGKSETILTDAQGKSLYYLTADSATTATCTGSCASTWPPLLSSTTPKSATSLPGALTLVQGTNGSQVSYNGHPLYRYSGDTASGQVNGNGIGGMWFVATPSLAAQSSGGGYGGYGGYGGGTP